MADAGLMRLSKVCAPVVFAARPPRTQVLDTTAEKSGTLIRNAYA